MSFTKYPKNYHANGYGWHNLASMSYPAAQPTAIPPSPTSSGASSLYPSQLSYGGMPALPNQQAYQQFSGMPQMPPLPGSNTANMGLQMSYGFAGNVSPAKIPNVRRDDTVDMGPSIGWSIGGGGGGGSGGFGTPSRNSSDSGVHDPIQAQTEIPCQAIHVPDEDMPIYSFGQPYVSHPVRGKKNHIEFKFFRYWWFVVDIAFILALGFHDVVHCHYVPYVLVENNFLTILASLYTYSTR